MEYFHYYYSYNIDILILDLYLNYFYSFLLNYIKRVNYVLAHAYLYIDYIINYHNLCKYKNYY